MKASEGLIRVMIDGDQHRDTLARYGVRGYPTVLFLDPDGRQVDQMRSRAPAAVKAQIAQVVEKHARR